MKTRFGVLLFLVVGVVLLAPACSESDEFTDFPHAIVYGDGNVIEQSRSISGFTRINHHGVGRLYIQQGAQEELLIRAEANLLEYLYVEATGGELEIWKDNATLLNTAPIEYHLTVVDLEQATLTGAGWIIASNLNTGPLTLGLSGVGSVEFINLNAPEIEVTNSGVGDVTLSGSVQEQTIELKTMGSYNGRDLASDIATVRITNMGSATVRVQDLLNVTIRGSGSAYYIGDPTIESSISGSGRVVKIEG